MIASSTGGICLKYEKVCSACNEIYTTDDPTNWICPDCEAKGFDPIRLKKELQDEIAKAKGV